MGPGDLARLLAKLSCVVPPSAHPDLLVPAEQGADAGVFRVAPDVAIVQSADFFPPMLDDPAAFGRIAAANALSDIYACGARPVTAINLLAVPAGEADDTVVAMLAGAASAVAESGAVMVGGHTILDAQVKFGLAVTGVVHPDRIVRHNTPRAGDLLVLTKPLGTALTLTAYGRGMIEESALAPAVAAMSALNKAAGEALWDMHASASTDITGFGLLGHLLDMLSGGELGAEVDYAALPLLPRTLEYAEGGALCGGTKRNLEFYADRVDYGSTDAAARIVLNDAQTSGGLLVALPEDRAAEFCALIEGATVIGRIVPDHPGRISVR